MRVSDDALRLPTGTPLAIVQPWVFRQHDRSFSFFVRPGTSAIVLVDNERAFAQSILSNFHNGTTVIDLT